MMRSLYSAISGLKNHQIKMDVTGDNIANVNTTGFKKSRVTFGTMLSQTTKGASAPSAIRGGTNAIQIGLGAMIGSVDKIMGQGSAQYTGQTTDMMLQGNGYFVLQNGTATVFTRAGAFGLDSSGNLIDPATGAFVKGYSADSTGQIPAASGSATLSNLTIKISDPPKDAALAASGYALESYSIDQNGIITGVYTKAGSPSTTCKIGQIAVATFANDGGLINVGNNFFAVSNNSGTPSIGAPGTEGRALIMPNNVEMSNVDLSQEMTDMIVTQRGFQANSRVITVSDTLLEELINLKR